MVDQIFNELENLKIGLGNIFDPDFAIISFHTHIISW